MKVREMAVPDAYHITPHQFRDERGSFYESFRHDRLAAEIGRPVPVAQVNYSVSRRRTLRGLHGTLLPPGQAKVVCVVRGAVLDIVVDLRVGSPTWGVHEANWMSAESGEALFVAEGLVHGFLALTDDTCVSYLCSTEFVPGTQVDIDPLDPELALPWGLTETPLMSVKDSSAMTVAQARETGLLAGYEDCLTHYAALREAAR
ncbi:dTDP-4-dehydrorhamnose 3,5-epimerase family protein [Streptomyces europaeiscabiei]|uniref:dTDP-4-dehydrorhamnose 3,5-epimerase family protein n=2 Tax=Streptomyces TaxID=1883 RepID=UPI001C501ECC|nr:dTDP-4-dehydrorhamnose 3,5-epimerase family protein [Streptomyces europaeiscabiei]MDX3588500.1 dTDP-4-dehydrorhamnose 3,5-epimerase family protein [Streptomyces europaeiscabiei]MDX3630354.1 dTDP-4-dehydrorhamnose 3,5-epimerase family protein [Streptomyces europaeiscabiei]MDX3648491.1 dTDP-4-dehydrorhamnose 3,5-epimerase family protein [Streptomyces europaeiscabiei]WUD30988.1 dTDP-4-dehydrorhamnose 3,5-epimerase family protein [Streptomyces europaeiscabiei]